MASKIPQIIITNLKGLIDKMLPPIIQTAIDTGIENIGEPNVKLPDYCLPIDSLQNILKLRNNLLNELNNCYKTIESLSKVTNVLQPAISSVNLAITTTKTAEQVALSILKAWPEGTPVPGKLIDGIFTLDNLNRTLPPILTKNINKLDSVTTAVDFALNMLLKLKNLLETIDKYLVKCGMNPNDLIPLDENLKKLEETLNEANVNLDNTNQVYKGFVLAIVEEPYSPTVNRRKAVARNTQGIVLLSTPLTFSTENQVLIQEIKLLIDANNLKAD